MYTFLTTYTVRMHAKNVPKELYGTDTETVLSIRYSTHI